VKYHHISENVSYPEGDKTKNDVNIDKDKTLFE
jgi:hypothetical protein